MDAMQVFGIVFPFVLGIIIAALIVGARSSGRERTRASAFELRLRETVFTGAEHTELVWPRERRRPSMASALRIGDMYGYELTDRIDRDHDVLLRFTRRDED